MVNMLGVNCSLNQERVLIKLGCNAKLKKMETSGQLMVKKSGLPEER